MIQELLVSLTRYDQISISTSIIEYSRVVLYGAILYEVLSVKSASMGAHIMIKNRSSVTELFFFAKIVYVALR